MQQMPGTVAATGTPRWRKFSVSESAFTAAATSEDIELFSLSAGELIHAVKIKHSTAFSGGGATSFSTSVGIAGDLDKYASAFDVFQAVSSTAFQITSVLDSESHGSAVSIRIEAVSNVNVGDLTAGSVDVWVLISKAT